MQNRKNSELFEYITQSGMTKAQIISRLNEMIDAESLKPEEQRDAEFISACLELQYFVTTGEEYQSSKEVAKKKLMQAIHVQKEDRNKAKPRKLSIGVAAACVACLFLVLPIVGQTLLERRWIEGMTVEGGEVYRLNGNEIDPDLLKEVIAEDQNSDMAIQTDDYTVISLISGVKEMHPGYIPNNWFCIEYSYEVVDGTVFYKERYSNSDFSNDLVIKCISYADIESVNTDIEQDQDGYQINIGEINVYISTNIDMTVATWDDGLQSFSVYGPIKTDSVQKIIKSIGADINEEK